MDYISLTAEQRQMDTWTEEALLAVLKYGRLQKSQEVVTMMTFIDTSNEEDLLTHEVSDEALEAAGAYEVAANFTLAACTNMWQCAA